MEKKYYDLIISLIKAHRKYPGLEVLLEDIANDVYERSKIVFGTINNDSVISEYLQKVIAVSIVTVPKKMNFNVNSKHRTISSTIIANPEQKTVVQQPVLAKAEPVIIETNNLELKIEEPSLEQNLPIEEELNVKDEELDSIIVLDENNSEDSNFILEEELLENSEDVILIDEPETDEEIEEIIEETVLEEKSIIENAEEDNSMVQEKVNKDLVDMMINGVPNSEQAIESTNLEEETNEEKFEELLVQSDDLLDEDLSIEMPEIDNSEELIAFEDETLEEINHSDLLENDGAISTPVEDLTLTKTNFECFNYEPAEIIVDEDEIRETLIKLDKKYPQYNIFSIVNLKYNKKLSIDEIAENLSITKESVVDILILIIDSLGDYDINALSQM